MTVRKKIFIVVMLLAAVLVVSYFFVDEEQERHITDSGFIMLENTLSPNQQNRILVYHYDIGATGYSRAFWAITPTDFQTLNLSPYELPDGYMAAGWSDEGELLVKKWEPYYYRQKFGELATGNFFKGVKVQLVEAEESMKSPLPKK